MSEESPFEVHEPELPFPKKVVFVRGVPIEEYIIPADKPQEVLEALYPFTPAPSLEEEMYDLHEEKKFSVRDYKVVRERGTNMLVSPYYYSSGGSVIDWVPVGRRRARQRGRTQQ